ncbi:putative bifunctional diguanylate cyclase/phosphodiesterase [Thalassobaculum fulvum]|uniref:putative bifunctional diguanylate cyclase/phosphodiesterase n=1 Tax=Thalassobaculum fulvum TaxID=1633335 RepID=UPI00167823B0|nr:EAL domain-containing protein [Thalassobaculum fulvum]
MRSLTTRLLAQSTGVSLALLLVVLAISLELTIRQTWDRAEKAISASEVSVQGAAEEALWQFNLQQADRLVEGLTNSPLIRTAILRDDSGEVIAKSQRSPMGEEWLSRSLLTGNRPGLDRVRAMVRSGSLPGEASQPVGNLELQADYAALHALVLDQFLKTFWTVALLGSFMMASIFVIALMTTARPLQRLADSIRAIGASYDPGAGMAAELVQRDDEIGQVARAFISTVKDLSHRTREAEDAQTKLRNILDGSLQAIVVHRDLNLLFANDAAARMFGYVDAGEMLEACDLRKTFPLNPDGSLEGFVDIAGREDLEEVHLLTRPRLRRDGSRFLAEIAARKIRWEGEWAVQVALIDVSARVRAEQELRDLATRDALTHLPNKSLFLEQLGFALRDARPGRLGILFVNVNRMKGFNDALGLAGGDELLRHIGERLRSQISGRALIAKFPGDKFAVLMPAIDDESEMIALAQRFDELLRARFTIAGQSVQATLSYGAAVWPFDGRNAEELTLAAERACGSANMRKARQVVFSDQSMNAEASRRYDIESQLAEALTTGGLDVHYQPKIRVDDGRIVGAEALIRWPTADGGFISPAEFIPVAESTGQIIDLGRFVVRRVCADQERLARDTGLMVPVAVNVSAIQFQNDDMLRTARQALEAHRLPPSALQFEVTESATMDQIDEVVPMLAALRTFGIRIAIDDFGTGYSSLSHLKRLPIDYLKLDRSFTRDVLGDDGRSIASAIVGLGHALGLTVIAEGVETDDEAAVLRHLGYDEFQGFRYARPMPIERYQAWILDQRAVGKA